MNKSSVTRALLSSTVIAAIGVAHAAHAQTEINAGGSSLASPTYNNVFTFYSTINPAADFFDYYNTSGSGAAQQALITNTSNVAGGAVPFDLGASDATANDAQQVVSTGFVPTSATNNTPLYYAWNNPTNTVGKSAAGDLIIIPSIGTPITVPFNFAGVASNTAINLTDAQLCGIYSGAITNANDANLTGSGIPTNAGALTVAYRSDGSGTSFLLTQHLAAVCAAGIGPDAITFKATTTFASLFPSSKPPSNFTGASGSAGVQGVVFKTPASIGYLSPDYTQIISGPTLGTGVTKAPYVAEVKGVQPTPSNSAAALTQGVPVIDPALNTTNAAYNTNDPNSFVPVAANPSSGYPIVGYTTLWAAQCYADPNVASAIRGFVTSLYRTVSINSLESASGFTPVPAATSARVSAAYLSASSATEITGAGTGGCAGLVGR
jgi:ABC-type phosphate transport system substrate-binding protein